MNYRNRTDSSALVFAQREMDQMLDQPLNPTPPQFTDALGNVCYLGQFRLPEPVQGSPVVVVNNQPLINFNAAPVTNYSFYLLGFHGSQRNHLRRPLGGYHHGER